MIFDKVLLLFLLIIFQSVAVIKANCEEWTDPNSGHTYSLDWFKNDLDFAIPQPPQFRIYLNFCKPLTNGGCRDPCVACRTWSDGQACLGNPNEIHFNSLPGEQIGFIAHFYGGDYSSYPQGNFKSEVNFFCDPSALETTEPFFFEENPELNFVFNWFTPKACPRSGTGNSGLGVGSALLITATVLIFVYIVGGLAVNKFYFKKEGKEIFPNYYIWVELGSLIWDGCKYSFMKSKALAQRLTSGEGGS